MTKEYFDSGDLLLDVGHNEYGIVADVYVDDIGEKCCEIMWLGRWCCGDLDSELWFDKGYTALIQRSPWKLIE